LGLALCLAGDCFWLCWDRKGKPYNAAAGHWRNGDMARFANALVAVWDGHSNGTRDMIEQAYRHSLFVYVHNLKEKR
jgi:hypothetical protein